MLQAGSADAQNVPLADNHPAEIAQMAPLGRAASYRRLNLKVVMALRNRAELDKLLAAQLDPASPQYHRWLTPESFAARFGPQAADYKAVTDWLISAGLKDVSANPRGRYVTFSAMVPQAERLFGVTIASTLDDRRFANLEDPAIPAKLAGVVSAIEGLDNLRRFVALIQRHRRQHRAPIQPQLSAQLSALERAAFVPGSYFRQPPLRLWAPNVTVNGYSPAFGPADIQTFYDETPLLNAGINGGNGQDCVALVEDSNYVQGAVDLFDTTFSMPAVAITNSFPTRDPGINGDEAETLMDIEYAHAVAPGAPLRAYIGNNSDPIIDSITDAIQSAVNDDSCSAISVSFASCGASRSHFTATLDPIFIQAASQGQSVFITAGSEGAAGLVLNRRGDCAVGSSRHVNEIAADPNVTGVGGTEFTPDFDANGDDVGFVSENVWNELGGATGGGASAIFAKPAYQQGVTPSDNHRDVPDVAMISSPDMPGVFLGDDTSDPGSACPPGQECIVCCVGGTSLSTQLWGGISRVLAQVQGGRLGNLNPLLYRLGTAKSTGLRDVTTGNNDFNGVTGFSAGPGYDQASGWGTLDIATLAQAFPIATPTPTPPIAEKITVTPELLSFGKVALHKTSEAQFVTIKNAGKEKTGLTVTITGETSGLAAFTVTSRCTEALAPQKTCKVGVVFNPGASTATQNGTLTIDANVAGFPSFVTLKGSGQGK